MELPTSLDSIDEVVQEITRLHKSLPPRPSIDDALAAKDLIQTLDKNDQLQLQMIASQPKEQNVPQELIDLLFQMQKTFVLFKTTEQKREALQLLNLEDTHNVFDEIIQNASEFVAGGSTTRTVSASKLFSTGFQASSASGAEKGGSSKVFSKDDSFVTKTKAKIELPASFDSGRDADKLSLIKLASLIEDSSKNDINELNLSKRLLNQVECLPDSICKLTTLTTLDLSGNHIVKLPTTISNLFSLSILDLRRNELTYLPASFGKLLNLEELYLSSNNLQELPESIGLLVKLKKLFVETNKLEEVPHTIGKCTSLQVLHADHNQLIALPDAVGRIVTLEILSLRYNCIKKLPATVSDLLSLRELDISFNNVESIHENLCFDTSLVKLNVGNNFATLRSLPLAIGNLENLEELDMSNNQIRLLPYSFHMLRNLRVFNAEGNPLEIPPRDIAEDGAQAVVQFMADFVAKKDAKGKKKKNFVKNLFRKSKKW